VTGSLMNDPEHWRLRAAEARAVAAQLSDTDSKSMMLRIADDYEELARRAEGRPAQKITTLSGGQEGRPTWRKGTAMNQPTSRRQPTRRGLRSAAGRLSPRSPRNGPCAL
jgi:hypothetical protein